MYLKKCVTLYTLCLVILLTAFLVSCESEVIPYKEELINVSFARIEEKTLEATIDTEPAKYTYTAEALFTLSDGSFVYGDTNGEEVLIGAKGDEMVGPFTQGKWRFHVYAYNKDGALIRDGETDVYLKKDEKTYLYNVVTVNIKHTELRSGSVHFSFKATRVDSSDSIPLRVEVTPVRQGEMKAARVFYSNSKTETEEFFDFTLTGLQSGIWEFWLEIFDGKTKLGGSMVSTYILGNGTTEVTGEIYPSEWLVAGFNITMPRQVEGTIGKGDTISPGEVTFKWKNWKVEPSKYEWFVNGVLIESGDTLTSFTYNFTAAGIYSVTCVAYDSENMEMGSSTCTMTVETPETPKATFKFSNPKKATGSSGTLPKAVTRRPIVRVNAETEEGTILCSGLPELTETNGKWQGSITGEDTGLEITIVLTGTTLTLSYNQDVVGTVSVEVSL